jgi:uncharacterized protein (TIGR02265 family)
MTNPIPGKMIDGVFRRVLAGEVNAALSAQLADIGLDLTLPTLAPTYPRETWYLAISHTATSLFPADTIPLRRLGRHVIEALERKQLIKGPWVSMARLLGPRRALRQAAERLDNNVVKLTIAEKSKTEFEIVAEEMEQAEFLAGLLEASIGMLGGRESRTTIIGPRGNAMVFSATWR